MTSYSVEFIIDHSGGGFPRSPDNPSTSFSKRYSKYGGLSWKTKCIKHVPKFYIGNGKGVATALNKEILEYPIQLIQIQCKVAWMISMKILQFVQDPIKYLL